MRVGLLALCVAAGCGFQHGQAAGDPGDGDAPPVVADALPDVPADSWWNTDWGIRIPITITNGSTTTLPVGYQVGVAQGFGGSSPCVGVRNEIRVVYRDTIELTRVFDGVGPPPFVWFPLAGSLPAGATSAGEYWFYCVNPNAGVP